MTRTKTSAKMLQGLDGSQVDTYVERLMAAFLQDRPLGGIREEQEGVAAAANGDTAARKATKKGASRARQDSEGEDSGELKCSYINFTVCRLRHRQLT